MDGVLAAGAELRGILRTVLRGAYRRNAKEHGRKHASQLIRETLAAISVWPSVSPVYLIDTPWRRQAAQIALGPWEVQGRVEVEVSGRVEAIEMGRAVARCVADLFRELPDLHRCVLNGQAYHCHPEPVICCEYVQLAPDEIRALIWRPNRDMALDDRARTRAMRSLVRAFRSPLGPVGMELLTKWNQRGYLRPSASFQLSVYGAAGRIQHGGPTLPPGNGIPWAFGVAAPVDVHTTSIFRIDILPDHRAVDPAHIARVFEWIEDRVGGYL